ncbi:hypothetical protein [Hymenobacter sp. BT730]|uniref:hypothetical protein n=1 Tax=Hymenobacter sp. BT730 TaxID=3063332 RepID=UPI0026E02451|nr:hypothetical protein [Hymenobacter sp. BT730]
MALRLSVICLLVLSGLAACSSDPDSNPRFDFVGSTRLTSNDRILTTPGDTLTTRVTGDLRNDKEPLLKHYTITVDYFAREKDAEKKPSPLVYFDTTFSSPTFNYQLTFGARTTSGAEKWTHSLTNADNKTSSRGYRLTVNNADSAKPYHPYKVFLEAARRTRSRSTLNARQGLVFPGFTVSTNPNAQQLVDLIALPSAAGGIELASPSDATVADAAPFLNINIWPTTARNATSIRRTSLTSAQFNALTKAASIVAVYDTADTPSTPTRSGALVKDNVLVFRTAAGRTGVLLVEDVTNNTATPRATVQVRIDKE